MLVHRVLVARPPSQLEKHMSLLDQITGQAASALGGNANAGAIGEISRLVGAKGVDGLVSEFQAKGLGDLASSWVGTGKNLPVSQAQIAAVLGSPQVASIAKSLGVSPEEASKMIATYLPQVVDKLTPDGKAPSPDVLQQGLAMLKGLGG